MLHDFNDLFLEAAKMARYTEHHTVRFVLGLHDSCS